MSEHQSSESALIDLAVGTGSKHFAEFPEEFRAWLEYLELADPHAYALFAKAADIDLC